MLYSIIDYLLSLCLCRYLMKNVFFTTCLFLSNDYVQVKYILDDFNLHRYPNVCFFVYNFQCNLYQDAFKLIVQIAFYFYYFM